MCIYPFTKIYPVGTAHQQSIPRQPERFESGEAEDAAKNRSFRLCCFELLHAKNVEFKANIRGAVNYEYNQLMIQRKSINGLIPGGEDLERLGLDKTTPIIRPDLFFQAYHNILSNFNDHSPLTLKMTTDAFFHLLHEENVKHSANIRGMINQRYNALLASVSREHEMIPGSNDLELLGMDRTTTIVRLDLYLKAYGEILSIFEFYSPPDPVILPIFEFDQPVLLTNDQMTTLLINNETSRSVNPTYKDSFFDIIEIKEIDEILYIVTRRKNVTIPILDISVRLILPPNSLPRPKTRLLPKRELTVSELPFDREMFKKVGQVAREWQHISSYKYSKALRSLHSSHAIFYCSQTLSKLIAQCMENPDETKHLWDKICICRDAQLQEIQAIALVKIYPQYLKINHITTHPRNIRSPVNETEPSRVEGAGSAIIRYLVATLPSNCEKICLDTVGSAITFYEKCGFEKLDPLKYPPLDGDITMILTKKKIQSLFEKAA